MMQTLPVTIVIWCSVFIALNIPGAVQRATLESANKIATLSDCGIDVVACEPLISSPVAFDWSADGKLWVVEMGDYPLGKNSGNIQVLESANGEGVCENIKQRNKDYVQITCKLFWNITRRV